MSGKRRDKRRRHRGPPVAETASGDGATTRGRAAVLPHLLAVIALLAAGLAAYGPRLDGPFLYDDIANIDIRARESVHPGYWDAKGLSGLRRFGFYRWLAFDRARTRGRTPEESAPAFRTGNLAVHLASALAAYVLALMLLRRGGKTASLPPSIRISAAAVGAGLFLLHPLAAEVVGYISARNSSTLTLCGLLLLMLSLAALDPLNRERLGRRHKVVRTCLTTVAAALVLTVIVIMKETGVILFLMPLLVLWLFGGRRVLSAGTSSPLPES